jgi:penicillin-binding protein 1B
VYLNAFESGRYHLASLIDDTPFISDPSQPEAWTPHNFDGKYHGPVPLVRALGDSLNVATVRLGLALGVEKIAQRLAELIEQPIANAYPSLLLGAVDLSPMDMARLYTVFASGGFSARLKSVVEVRDEAGALAEHYPISIRNVADASAIAQLNSGLRSVMSRGTGKTSRFRNRGVAGKTGTSDDFRDSWFVGFDNWHLSVIWIGYDDNRPVGLTGATGAMQVWDTLMRSLNPVPLNQPLPAGLIERDLDYATGTWARDDCAATVRIVLPKEVDLPAKPGCGPSLGERVKSWFD